MPVSKSHEAVSDLDVTVVVPFGDDEEHIGGLLYRVASHLSALHLRFEILAVEEKSVDNSVAVLKLLKRDIKEMRMIEDAGEGAGFEAGAKQARGRVLWLFDVARADASLSPFGWAYGRVAPTGSNAVDAVSVTDRYVVCRRLPAWKVISTISGRGKAYDTKFVKKARSMKLHVETPRLRFRKSTSASFLSRRLAQLLGR